MNLEWTREQVLALAPDAASAQAARALSQPGKWSGLGRNQRAVWGEQQGGGKDPYRARIDLQGPVFKCSCPSRKFPCKHCLGLFLALVEEPGFIAQAAPPAWVAEWLQKHEQGIEAKARKTESQSTPIADPEAQVERARRRESRVAEGLAELALWLRDLVRQGLAMVLVQPASFFESMAARLVDAQAPGVARRVRGLHGLGGSGNGRERRLLERIAQLHLLVEGYQRFESLAFETQTDIRSTIGWTVPAEELLQGVGVRGVWKVLGRRAELEDRLRVLRTWLWCAEESRYALILRFAAGSQPMDLSLVPGTEVGCDLGFFPGSVPLRALEKSRHCAPRSFAGEPLNLGLSVKASVDLVARAFVRNPWLERHPMSLRGVIPGRRGEDWLLCCTDGSAIPVAGRFKGGWELLAMSGGRPLGIFGEWDGHELHPLGAWTRDGFCDLGWVEGA